jgi:hypothetical protein
MVELKQAPFSQADKELVPGSPGSLQGLSQAGREQPRPVPGHAGRRLHRPGVLRRRKVTRPDAEVLGQKVLSEKEAKKAFPYGPHLADGCGYVDLADRCDEAPGKGAKTYEQVLKKKLRPADVVLAVDPKDQLRRLLPKDRAKEILKELGIGKAKEGGGARSPEEDRWRREERERARKAKAAKEAARRANGVVAAKAEQALGAALINCGPDALALLRSLVGAMAEFCWSDACRQVEIRRGEKKGDGRDGANARATVRELVDGARSAGEVAGLFAELVAARESLTWGGSYSNAIEKDAKGFWAAWGVDPKGLLKEVQAEAAAKGKGGKKKAGKAKAPPAAPGSSLPAAVTRETPLSDLLPTDPAGDFVNASVALDEAGLATVGDLLDRAAAAAKGPDSQRPYTVLSGLPHFSWAAANAIGDALIDAGLFGPKPAPAAAPPAKKGRAKRPTKAEALDAAAAAGASEVKPPAAEKVARKAQERFCRVCGCTDANCRQCIEKTGAPCCWVDEDLCSACVDEPAAAAAEREAAHA